MAIGAAFPGVSSPFPAAAGPHGDVLESPHAPGAPPRRRSLHAPQDDVASALTRLMERTLHLYPGYHGQLVAKDGKIHEPFVSLAELFRSLPEDVTFDIELSSCKPCPVPHVPSDSNLARISAAQ
jgi:hypothetical protein